MEQTSTGRDNGKSEQEQMPTAPFVDQQAEISPEMLEQIFVERAARLAQAPEEEETGEQITLLLVRLGRETYGLDALYVDRIEPVEHITRVPRVPNWVAGVTNLRGRVLSVINLSRLFDLPAATPQEDDQNGLGERTEPYLVAVEAAGMMLALVVDGVLAVERIPMSRIREATDTVRGLRSEYVHGVTERGGNAAAPGNGTASMVTVLNLPNLLADERLIVHEEIV